MVANREEEIKMVYNYPNGKIFNKKGEIIEKAFEYRGREPYYVAFTGADGTHLFAYEYKCDGGRRIFYDGRKVRLLTDSEIKEIIIKDQTKVKKNMKKYLEETGTVALEKSDDKGWVKL